MAASLHPDPQVEAAAFEAARYGDASVSNGLLRSKARLAGVDLTWDAAADLLAAARTAAKERGYPTEEPPLFTAADTRFGRFLASDPPPRRWLLRDVLPAGVAGLLASMGGAGKSYLAYQLGVCVSGGLPWLGFQVDEPGGVLYLAAEDDEGELHRRGRTLLDHLAPGDDARRGVADRLHVVSRVAEDNLLTASVRDGEVAKTRLVGRLIDAAAQIPNLRLILIDPVSRFRGGNAISEEVMTRYVEAQEAIRQATGATVLGLAHVSQAGIKDGGGQEIVRGNTALVDGMRWVATLQRVRRDQAGKYGLDEDEADRYLRLEIPKSNYTAPFAGMWLRREAGGVLVPTEVEPPAESRRRERDEATYLDVVARLQRLLREEGPLTRRNIRDMYAGASGILGAGDKTVRSVIERAVRDKSLIERPGDTGTELHPPPADDAPHPAEHTLRGDTP